MARFPPEHMVTMLVTFNRTLYAQLKQQEFQVRDFYVCTLFRMLWSAVGLLQYRAQALQRPGTKCKVAAADAEAAEPPLQAPPAYPMPPANSAARPAAELGMKLACGFEMLCATRAGDAALPAGAPLVSLLGVAALHSSASRGRILHACLLSMFS